jgi:energy-coupling factor transporter ATP-binding protein EcfA2
MTNSPLAMPNPSNSGATEVPHLGVIVIVGANGSGKSRFGRWLEKPKNALQSPERRPQVWRIGAQRSILMNGAVPLVKLTDAKRKLEAGGDIPGIRESRIPGDGITQMQHDFDALMQTLFAQRREESIAYTAKFEGQVPTDAVPVPTLNDVKRVWDLVFPHRSLVLESESIRVKQATTDNVYDVSNMSDGERVGFYLIGQTLLAPKDMPIVIDEPELHLHESLQGRLWDVLQAERQDCTFIYITHDLDFAASRADAPKVLLMGMTSIEPPTWDWEILPGDLPFPEDLVLRIAGSRRPVMFVEGIKGSLDQNLYEAIAPERYVVPSGGCDEVIRAVKVFRAHGSFHRADASGVIDGDDRAPNEIAAYERERIVVLPVAQVENLMLLPEVLAMMAEHLKLDPTDAKARIDAATLAAVKHLDQHRLQIIWERSQNIVSRAIGSVSASGNSSTDLVAAVQSISHRVDAAGIYGKVAADVDNAISTKSFQSVLKLVRHKGLLPVVARAMKLQVDEYRRIVLALLQSNSVPRPVASGDSAAAPTKAGIAYAKIRQALQL